MAVLSKKQVVAVLEGLKEEQYCTFLFPPVFGGNNVVVRANKGPHDRKNKRYSVLWGSDPNSVTARESVFHSNKAKDVAAWVVDRNGDLVGGSNIPTDRAA